MDTSDMDTREWVFRCSARLHAQWPRLPRDQLDEVASDLGSDHRWRDMTPETAAVNWLSQGIPVQGHSDVRPSP